MRGYRYVNGGENGQEAVEFDITRHGRYLTTCVGSVQLLIAGVNALPCGDGDDFRITPGDRLEMLRFVEKNREELRKAEPVRTLQGWRNSGLSAFLDYVHQGDQVSQDIVDQLMNGVPPISLSASCMQMGEPHDSVCVDGFWRDTYLTFHRMEGFLWQSQRIWIYDGTCFKGENINRGDGLSGVQRAIRIWEGK